MSYPNLSPELPPQTDLLGSAAVVTEAYTFIPGSVMRDIVTSILPEFTDSRAWILNRPVAGGATTFAQMIVDVAPGGGSDAAEPQAEVSSFVFVQTGSLDFGGDTGEFTLDEGGFARLLPAGLLFGRPGALPLPAVQGRQPALGGCRSGRRRVRQRPLSSARSRCRRATP